MPHQSTRRNGWRVNNNKGEANSSLGVLGRRRTVTKKGWGNLRRGRITTKKKYGRGRTRSRTAENAKMTTSRSHRKNRGMIVSRFQPCGQVWKVSMSMSRLLCTLALHLHLHLHTRNTLPERRRPCGPAAAIRKLCLEPPGFPSGLSLTLR